jgi:hypothetical protein
MIKITKSIRHLAVLASVFAVFGGSGLRAADTQTIQNDAPPCVDCLDDQTKRHNTNHRRWHSDLI